LSPLPNQETSQTDTQPGERLKGTLKHPLSRDFLAVLAVFSLALLVRILYNITIARDYQPIYDAALYHFIAEDLVKNHCYCVYHHVQSASRAPLWPFIMAGIYFFTGPNNFYARLFYCFLGSGTCLLIYYWARDLFGRRVALLTGLFSAIYVGLFIYDGWLYTESLYTFCQLAFAYMLYRIQRTPLHRDDRAPTSFPTALRHWTYSMLRQPQVYLCGIFLAMATLTRPNGSSLLAVVGVWAVIVLFARMIPWQAVISASCIIAVILVVAVAPWAYRNYQVMHAFVPVSTGFGEVLSGAYSDKALYKNPRRIGYWSPPDHTVIHDLPTFTIADENRETATGWTWIRTHLANVPYLMGLHFINMWRPYVNEFNAFPFEEHPQRRSSQIIIQYVIPDMSYVVFAMALLGLLTTWMGHKKQLLALYLTLALDIALNVIFYSNMRFRAPMEPFLLLLAGGFLWWLTSKEPGTLRFVWHKRKTQLY
ncbi:MAG TPA: hypothetical protein VKX46_01280, partial [Ktedonobacteraceae bacterium]|nr:hypothetical protein [Ktedonobacteraceae bacterium]